MKTKAYAFVSMIAFAVISPVVAAQAVTTGLGGPDILSGTPLQPFLQQKTTVLDERVGVKTGNTKTILFAVHSKTADSANKFVVLFPFVVEQYLATVTAAVTTTAGDVVVTCSTPSATEPGRCVFPSGTRIAKITFAKSQSAPSGSFSYSTYFTEYYQDCDSSARRFCGKEYTYNNVNYIAKFTASTEQQVGSVYQGDVDIFNGTVGVNLPKAGDVVSLHVSSDKAITTNIPTLRVKAAVGTVETQIGHRYPCKATDGSVRKEWDCEIPEGDPVPNLTGYTSPRIVFSSSRDGALATITIKNAIKTTNAP